MVHAGARNIFADLFDGQGVDMGEGQPGHVGLGKLEQPLVCLEKGFAFDALDGDQLLFGVLDERDAERDRRFLQCNPGERRQRFAESARPRPVYRTT